MIKLIGAVLILFACSGFGVLYCRQKRLTLKGISSLIENFSSLSRHLNFSQEPLQDILKSLSFGNENSFLSRFVSATENTAPGEFVALWNKTSDDYAKEKQLPKEALELLMSLGKNIGSLDKETEVAKIEETIGGLSEILEQQKENFTKNEKTVKSLSLTLGISIIILCI